MLAATAIASVAQSASGQLYQVNTNVPTQLAADDRGVYYTAVQPGVEFGEGKQDEIYRVDTEGGAARRLWNPTGGNPVLSAPKLSANGSYVFGTWGSTGSRTYALGGMAPEQLFLGPSSRDLLADDTSLWTIRGTDNIVRRDRTTGAILSQSFAPFPIVTGTLASTGDGSVYFAASQRIYRWTGIGAPVQIADLSVEPFFSTITDLEVSGSLLYFSAGRRIQSINRFDGSGRQDVAGTFAQSGTSNQILELEADDDNLYWIEQRGGSNGGTLWRRSLTVNDARILADRSDTPSLLRQNTNRLFWREASGIWSQRKLGAIFSERTDLYFDRNTLEVVQSLQTPDNSIPLIAGKRTILRCEPRSTRGTARDADIRLTARSRTDTTDFVGLGSIRPTRGLVEIREAAADRGDPESTVNFLLPYEWTFNEVEFSIEIDPQDNVFETDELNNEINFFRVRFNDEQPMCVDMRAIRTRAGVYRPFDPGYLPTVTRAETILPTTRLVPIAQPGVKTEPCYIGFDCFDEEGAYELNSDDWSLMNDLWHEEVYDSEPAFCDGDGWRTAMVIDGSIWGSAGLARLNQPMNITRFSPTTTPGNHYSPGRGLTLAHELTHNLGYGHVNCTGRERAGGSIDDNWPADIPTCAIGTPVTGPDRLLGYDFLSRSRDDVRVIEPQQTFVGDRWGAPYMSYSTNRWATPYHWNGIFDILDPAPVPIMPVSDSAEFAPITVASALINAGPTTWAVVHGRFDPISGAVQIALTDIAEPGMLDDLSAERLFEDQFNAANAAGNPWELEVLDENDDLLGLAFIAPGGGCCAPPTEILGFTGLVPVPADASPASVRIRARLSQQILAERTGSANAPSIVGIGGFTPNTTISAPINLFWTATDLDGDDLVYRVEYSADGGATWTRLASGLRSPNFRFEPDEFLQGSNAFASSRFRITANDGFNMGTAESAAFNITNRAPVGVIIEPADGAVFTDSEIIELRARAFDPEEYEIEADNRFTWQVTRTGGGFNLFLIGRQPQIDEGLPPGEYRVFLRPRDSANALADEESVTITVGEIDLPVITDRDGDGEPDATDNCPDVPNGQQLDFDADGVGDDCDNCPISPNPFQTDIDEDGIGDDCDSCNLAGSGLVSVDGLVDPGYGPPITEQTVQTSFGDNNNPGVGLANGSELDAMHVRIDCDTLYISLAGNLASDSTKLSLFFDTRSGGQNRLQQDNPPIAFGGLQRLSDDGSGNGMTFDQGFSPDYWINLSLVENQDSGATDLFVDGAELPSNGGGESGFFGLGAPDTDGQLLFGSPMFAGARVTVNNTNTAGVSGGTLEDSPGTVLTGIELAIPTELLEIDDSCSFSLMAVILGQNFDLVSNQVLPPVPAQGNLGDPRNVDFSTIPGQQFVEVSVLTAPPIALIGVPEPGGTAELAIAQTLPDIVSVIWRKDGVLIQGDSRITGADSTVLRINDLRPSDSGDYDAKIIAACGTVFSESFTIVVNPLCIGDIALPFGFFDNSDLFAIIDGIDAGEPSADVNKDGTLDVFDLIDALAGCSSIP
ncbi:MAG: thrombospondin type 3 repeat-containing protein [Planctomycetota bacterium]